jgi:uncharacterized protein
LIYGGDESLTRSGIHFQAWQDLFLLPKLA